METKILDCPFCGSECEPSYISIWSYGKWKDTIQCKDCGYRSPHAPELKYAIAMHNAHSLCVLQNKIFGKDQLDSLLRRSGLYKTEVEEHKKIKLDVSLEWLNRMDQAEREFGPISVGGHVNGQERSIPDYSKICIGVLSTTSHLFSATKYDKATMGAIARLYNDTIGRGAGRDYIDIRQILSGVFDIHADTQISKAEDSTIMKTGDNILRMGKYTKDLQQRSLDFDSLLKKQDEEQANHNELGDGPRYKLHNYPRPYIGLLSATVHLINQKSFHYTTMYEIARLYNNTISVRREDNFSPIKIRGILQTEFKLSMDRLRGDTSRILKTEGNYQRIQTYAKYLRSLSLNYTALRK